MFESIVGYFLVEPRRLVSLGRALISGACFLFVAGLAGRLVCSAPTVLHSTVVPASLETLLPDAPTWWIPETALGVCFVVLLLVAGFVAVQTGRLYERATR